MRVPPLNSVLLLVRGIVRQLLTRRGWVSKTQACETGRPRGCPARIWFDHDLGGDDSAIVVAKWLIDTDLDYSGRFIPDKFDFSVRNANPVGAANIQVLLNAYLSYKAKKRSAASG